MTRDTSDGAHGHISLRDERHAADATGMLAPGRRAREDVPIGTVQRSHEGIRGTGVGGSNMAEKKITPKDPDTKSAGKKAAAGVSDKVAKKTSLKKVRKMRPRG